MKKFAFWVAAILVALPNLGFAHEDDKAAIAKAMKQAAVVGAELGTIAKHLQTRPQAALDFSNVSGEYCFNGGIGKGGHMTHYAIDPARTSEDVIDFVNAKPLLAAGINVDSLPKFPGSLDTMKPNQWYFLPAKEFEPHHGKTFPFPLIIRASNLN